MSALNILTKMRTKQGLVQKPWFDKETIQETPNDQKFRFPDQAKVEAVYHAAKENWTATLTINGEKYKATDRGIHVAIFKLGQEYQNSKEQR